MFFFELMQICIVFVLSAYICIVSVDPVIKIMRVGIPLTGLTPPYSQGRIWISNTICPGLCLFNRYWLRCKLVVSFVDIGGIVEHYCLYLDGPEYFLLMSVV